MKTPIWKKYITDPNESVNQCSKFTPYNPESPSLQTGDDGNFKSKDKEKPRPLGRGYTGFTKKISFLRKYFLTIRKD
jgi:hypothetical protein